MDELLARVSARGDVAWYLTDRLGSTRDLTDAAGAVGDHLDYDGFGQVTGETNPSYGDRFKYTGRELDPATGLQYNRGRYYDAAIGSWTGPDPVGFGGGDANLYRYVGNDPTGATDPSGLDSVGVVGDKVYYTVEENDPRGLFTKFWDGMVGNTPNFDQQVLIGRVGPGGVYAGPNSAFTGGVLLGDAFGGTQVLL